MTCEDRSLWQNGNILTNSVDIYAISCTIVSMKRYLNDVILNDLQKKMVFITGPRQVGKTFLAKQVMTAFHGPQYLNFDSMDDARIIRAQGWLPQSDLVVLDEIHKMKRWKAFLKGVYDTRPERQALLVTGSARMDTFRQSGESLAGRYYHYRLLPISVREMKDIMMPDDALDQLNRLGGFPEPFLSASDTQAARWRNQYYTDLIREDIVEFERVHELRSMKLLLELLRSRVGSPASYASMAGDLQVAPNTVKRYVEILEALHVIFLVRPFHANVARAILKEPKVYFYDTGLVKGDDGIRLENTCALCLLKHTTFLRDTEGADIGLHYLRTRDGKEIDFVIARDGRPAQLIEIKLSTDAVAPALKQFHALLPEAQSIQLVRHLRREQSLHGVAVLRAATWLADLAA